QAGGYIQIADANVAGNCTSNLKVNGLNSTNVEGHGGSVGDAGCGSTTGIIVSGGASGGKFSKFGGANAGGQSLAVSGSANVFFQHWMDSGTTYATVTGNGSFLDVGGVINETTSPAIALTNFSGKAAFLVPYTSNGSPNITSVGFSGTGGANW